MEPSQKVHKHTQRKCEHKSQWPDKIGMDTVCALKRMDKYARCENIFETTNKIAHRSSPPKEKKIPRNKEQV